MIKIAVDAMGSESGPGVEIEGAVQAAAQYGVSIVLVGKEDLIHESLRSHDTSGLPIEVVNANDVITMEDSAANAARRKKDSSVHVAARLMRDAGINCILTYTVPSISLLDQALECGIRVIVNVPWMAYKCFLQDRRTQRTVRHEVRQAVGSCRRHPALLMYCVAKEIPPAIVRWPGAKKTDPPCRPRVFVRWRVKSCSRAGEGSSLGRY